MTRKNPSAAAAAYRRALQRLKGEHPDRFAVLLGEERVKLGLLAVPQRGGGKAVERVEASPLVRAVRPGQVFPKLGIRADTWSNWLRLGVPVDRKQDVADAIGVPVTLLWPEPEQAPAKVRPPKPVGVDACAVCGERFASRADLARHRLDAGHHTEDAA